jgi:hypothetical protein
VALSNTTRENDNIHILITQIELLIYDFIFFFSFLNQRSTASLASMDGTPLIVPHKIKWQITYLTENWKSDINLILQAWTGLYCKSKKRRLNVIIKQKNNILI